MSAERTAESAVKVLPVEVVMIVLQKNCFDAMLSISVVALCLFHMDATVLLQDNCCKALHNTLEHCCKALDSTLNAGKRDHGAMQGATYLCVQVGEVTTSKTFNHMRSFDIPHRQDRHELCMQQECLQTQKTTLPFIWARHCRPATNTHAVPVHTI